MKKYQLIISSFLIYIIINMALFPQIYIQAAYSGIIAWAVNVLPCILPFMILSKLLNATGATNKLSKLFAHPCKKLFNCPGICSAAFLTSVISGYPVGALMTAELYKSHQISRSQAFRMCSFCSTSGPMFIIGTVGTALLHNAAYGYIILASHVTAAILNGLIYRKLSTADLPPMEQDSHVKQTIFASTIESSVTSILSVGAIISLFFVIITAFSPLFNLFPPQISSVLAGLIEITKGCIDVSVNLHGTPAIVAASFIISFGGISGILQSFAMIAPLKMPIKLFILQKITHAVIAMGVSAVLCFIFL